jgi:endogenous inhibitor of DNA gyrase (YacG/DUF329 family)
MLRATLIKRVPCATCTRKVREVRVGENGRGFLCLRCASVALGIQLKGKGNNNANAH